jgi:PAS domain S-box-containing protein
VSIIALSVLGALAPCAVALDRSLDASQYAHTSWKYGQEVSPGTISSMAQTPDGYLWLGTEFGLRRFDGVRSVPWRGPAGEHLQEVPIRSLRAARDGRLWIGTPTGLASWKDGKLTHYPELEGYTVEALLEDRDGAIWAGGSATDTGRLCTIQHGRTQCFGEDGGFGSGVTVLCEDSKGKIWAAGSTGLWQWKFGPPKFFGLADASHAILALVESDDGGILIARHDGIIKLRNGRAEPFPLPGGMHIRPQRLFRDRDAGLWIGAAIDFGLLHVHEGTADLFGPHHGLSGSAVMCIFEDREGNVWVSTGDGLDRFRDYAVPTFSVEQGLASYGVDSVLAARDGSLWLGTSHGLNRLKKGQITVYRKRSERGSQGDPEVGGLGAATTVTPGRTAREIIDPGFPEEDLITTLFEDKAGKIWVANVAGVSFFESDRFTRIASLPPGAVFSIADGVAGSVWISQEGGLSRVLGGRVVERIPWAKLGRKKPANALLRDVAQGGIWLGFLDGGVAYFQDGQLRTSYGQREGLAEGMVYGFSVDGNGALWAATEGGLSRIKDDRVLTLNRQNGLPCKTVHWMRKDDFQSVWVNLPCGLVRIARSELDAWASHPERTIETTVFDSSDGVKSHRVHSGYDAIVSAIVTKAADGRLWFVPFGGVSVIDPKNLHQNKLPPPVHIEQVIADDERYDASNGLRLPSGVRNVAIDYTALSLVAPEKVRFRYKLEGQNRNWHEVVNDREVQYTNLGPGTYQFRVKACNNSGVWNETGDTLDFTIPPAWYQTLWFRAACVAAFLLLLWAIYQLRVQELRAQEKKFRDAVETMPALAFVNEPDGNRSFVNKAWLEYTGLGPEQASGAGWEKAIHPDDLKRVLERWRTAQSTGELPAYEVRVRRGSDGVYRWFQTRARPLLDRRGKVVKWCSVATDIEDRKRAEQLQADLAHVNRVSTLGELAASISHELNQPIAAAIMNADLATRLLERYPPDVTEARQRTTKIVEIGTLASEIIDRLRSLYKKEPPKRVVVAVNEVIGEMAELLRGQAMRHGASLRTDLADDLPNVVADRVQLQQVLMNVMLNGIEAMGETGGVLTVKSDIHPNGEIEISVNDTGPGLPPGKADQIFDAFFTTKPQGSGMGLAISKSIVESHGGRIWADGETGHGATFHFTLPPAPVEAEIPVGAR